MIGDTDAVAGAMVAMDVAGATAAMDVAVAVAMGVAAMAWGEGWWRIHGSPQ